MNTEQSKTDRQLEDQVTQALDNSIENLSPDIRRNLNRIRIEATEAKARPRSFLKYASVLSVAFALVVGWQLMPGSIDVHDDLFADLLQEVLQEDPEMLDELEFVYWMVEVETSGTL
jgi:hypothetical protein